MTLLVLLLVILIIATLKNKVYGLAFYFLIRLCIPDTCRVGNLSYNTVSLLIFVVLLIVFYHKSLNCSNSILLKFRKEVFFLFGGIILLSFFAVIVPLGYQYKYLSQFFVTEFIPSFCILLLISSEKEYKLLVRVMAFGALFNCAYGILTFFIDNNPIYDNLTSISASELAQYDREEGRFGFTRKAEGIYGKFNGKIMMSLISLIIFTFFYNKNFLSSKFKKLLLSSAFIVSVLTSQRSGLFGIFAFFILIISRKRIFSLLKKYSIFLVLAVFVIIATPQLQGLRDLLSSVIFILDDKKQDQLGTSGSSVEMRLEQFDMVWAMLSSGFLSGLGYAFDQYRGEFFRFDNDALRGLESFFLKILINNGLLGFILWGRFLYSLLKPTYKFWHIYDNKYFFSYLLAYFIAILFTDISGSFFLFLACATLNLIYMKFNDSLNKI